MNDNPAIVAYFRVSTKGQGESRLGLEAQIAAVEAYAKRTGARIIASFEEVESGKSHQNRPELKKALSAAKALRATLVVAKLDRLARNVAFISTLLQENVDVVFCDMPQANKLVLHILAAVAEDELERISSRLKAAFAVGRKKGRKYGGANPKCRVFDRETAIKGTKFAREVHTQKAREFRESLLPIVLEWEKQGKTHEQIAALLNEAGYRTRRNRAWSVKGVWRLLQGRPKRFVWEN